MNINELILSLVAILTVHFTSKFGRAQNVELIKMFLWLLFCTLCSNVSALDINQHTCSVQDLTLKCVYDGVYMYESDKLLTDIETLEFDFFSYRSILINNEHMLDLISLNIFSIPPKMSPLTLYQNVTEERHVLVKIQGDQGPSWPRILGRSDFSLQEN